MPPVTADDDSSKLIAYLIIVPVAILFAGIGVAISCSEKWNKSDNRLKRFLERRKSGKNLSASTTKTEDTTISETACCEPASSQGSSNTIVITDSQTLGSDETRVEQVNT
ncbi:hypothetical protein GJ744_007273 [Endocarpon pusillum]|uniref:Uncharacterized protein n=1 Tax=Endocarpon pusillum TaxID=364733 RepID=A0A8H7AM83_9EURO|nr:hypothetical protein GJ744_007273 [Endocarpon pusillum]